MLKSLYTKAAFRALLQVTICAFFQSPVSVCLKLFSYDRLWLVWLGMFLDSCRNAPLGNVVNWDSAQAEKPWKNLPHLLQISFDSHFVSFPGGCFDWLPVSHAFSASPCQLIVTCSARLWSYLIITCLTQRPELFSGWKLILPTTDGCNKKHWRLTSHTRASKHTPNIYIYWCKLRFEWYIRI